MKGSIFIIFSVFLTVLVSFSTQNAIGERDNNYKRNKMADLIFRRNPENINYIRKRFNGQGGFPGGIGGGNPVVPVGVNPIGINPIGVYPGGINPVNPGFNPVNPGGINLGGYPGGNQGNYPGGYPGGSDSYEECYGMYGYINPNCYSSESYEDK